MKRFSILFILLLFWSQTSFAQSQGISQKVESLKRFLGEPSIVEKSWLIETIPAWKKEEESRLQVYLKKVLTPKLDGKNFPAKDPLKLELKQIPNLGGLRIRNQKTELFHLVTFGNEFPNFSQIQTFSVGAYYVDFYLGRQGGIPSVEFPKAGLSSAFYYFSEDETLLYSQETSEWKIQDSQSIGELNSYFKSKSSQCQGCDQLRLLDGTLFFFPSQNTFSFWARFGLGAFLVLSALFITIFFFRNFLVRNRETLRKAMQAQKTLDQEKKSILSK
ncbi:hypothetical protein [Leptospira stimsonii]|uniref:ResB-like domain-containing protein n=1 Tax=Leptospira stimsonii TaxID=2202203 RepID=A0ABY2MXR9_9LEPT|nr:hypothetical protein [Leptospira stimsonii]TGK13364.1 hypothetical protein EHO98_18700 [Leptospira stimsonii]TGM11597.1 hypothetical protein EHQ90_15370 [Leptospira stimsonii]